jgi:hypothetical protein
MKYMVGTLGIVLFLALAMVGWSVAGRFMTAKDDVSVAIGIAIVGTILGFVAAGIGLVVWRIAKTLSATASIDAGPSKKH